jgi:hypothetical protein
MDKEQKRIENQLDKLRDQKEWLQNRLITHPHYRTLILWDLKTIEMKINKLME